MSDPASLPSNAPNPDRFAQLPQSLLAQARFERLGPAPALLVHPDWASPAPFVLWLHGRSVRKEIDPGRYLRWLRAGIAAVAIDLPAHGDRADEPLQSPERALEVLRTTLSEINVILAALADRHAGLFDPDRAGLGGMSLGGMITLRRLCDPHPFKAAAVEGTTGWLEAMHFPEDSGIDFAGAPHPRWRSVLPRPDLRELQALAHIDRFRPIPLLVLHSETDRTVSWPVQRAFLARLRDAYSRAGADPALIEVRTWPETGAPDEHVGFGRFAHEAKTFQTDFFARTLR